MNFQTTWILPTWGDPPGLILQHVPPQRITDLGKCHTNTPKLSCILDSCLSKLWSQPDTKCIVAYAALQKVPAPRRKNSMHRCHCQRWCRRAKPSRSRVGWMGMIGKGHTNKAKTNKQPKQTKTNQRGQGDVILDWNGGQTKQNKTGNDHKRTL